MQTSATEVGTELGSLIPNWNAGATITWPLYQGGLTTAQVNEAEANLSGIEAQADAQRLQVQVDVEQARRSLAALRGVNR